MSLSSAAIQPFECTTCRSRFTRQENLRRHAALHEKSRSSHNLACDLCQTTFSRRDLRTRHMKRKHPDLEHNDPHNSRRPRHDSAVSRASSRSQQQESVYSEHDTSSPPDRRQHAWPSWQSEDGAEADLRQQCHSLSTSPRSVTTLNAYADTQASLSWQSQDAGDLMGELATARLGTSATSSMGQYMHVDLALRTNTNSLSPEDFSHDGPAWNLSASQLERGLELFFIHISPTLPFIHRSTFDAVTAASPLVLSMLSLAYHYGEDPDSGSEVGSGTLLARQCYRSVRTMLTAFDEASIFGTPEALALVQAMLLQDIGAVLYLGGRQCAYGLSLHPRMISLARSAGLLQPAKPDVLPAGEDLDAVWRDFVEAESRKRTMLAVHQIDALWYHLLSTPRLLSHLEMKHDLPCPTADWMAVTSAQWAYRQLTAKSDASVPAYTDTVRRFLSSDPSLGDVLPTLDSFGLINIAHFLISSTREISGWSTITGRISMDRVEPLKASLSLLEAYIRPVSSDGTFCASNVACEATWEMAMVELHVWSLSHTGGTVQSSIDSLLAHVTQLAMTSDLVFNAEVVQAMQRHLDWFLSYLDSPHVPPAEPLWVAIYAYKVFLVAWQCMQQGLPGVMAAVNVPDGDTTAAVAWARAAFRPRARWHPGKLILGYLDVLEGVS